MKRAAWLAALWLLASCSAEPSATAGSAQQVQAVVDGCVQEMLRSTCRVVNDKSELPSSEVVLIAGVGRVDAKAYRALREAGEGMCTQVRSSCGTVWEGAPCRTARALWGGPAHKPR